jgi:hypothetical protein
VDAREITQHFDSVSVCLSKGLARRWVRCCAARRVDRQGPAPAQDGRRRHAAGRDSGGGGLYALDNTFSGWLMTTPTHNCWPRACARRFEVEPVQTNMVYVQMGDRAEALKAFAAERGIKLSAAARLRMVTHMDVSAAQIEQVSRHSSTFRASDSVSRPIDCFYRINTLYPARRADIMRPFAVASSVDVSHRPLAAASVEEPNEKRRNP